MNKDAGDLVARYLQAIELLLPMDNRDEILEDQALDLEDEIKAKKEELGRDLMEEDVAAILKNREHPLVLATKQWPQRSLIGPLHYPQYVRSLKVIALACLVLWIFQAAIVVLVPAVRLRHAGWDLLATFLPVWNITFYSIALITFLYILIEQFQFKRAQLDNWNPRKLARLRHEERVSRSSSTIALFFSSIFLLLWLNIIQMPVLSGWGISLAPPVSSQFIWPIATLLLTLMIVSAVSLLWPWWTRSLAGIRLAIDVFGLVVFFLLLRTGIQDGALIEVTSLGFSPPDAAAANRLIAVIALWGVVVVAAWFAVRIVQDLRKLCGQKTRSPRPSVPG